MSPRPGLGSRVWGSVPGAGTAVSMGIVVLEREFVVPVFVGFPALRCGTR